MPLTVPLTLSDEQLATLADMVAERMGKVAENPLTVREFAKAISRSEPYVKARVDAGLIRKLPGPGDTLIPYSELTRFRTGA